MIVQCEYVADLDTLKEDEEPGNKIHYRERKKKQ